MALLLSPLRAAVPSASSGILVMSISVTQAPRFDLLVRRLRRLTFTSRRFGSGDKKPVNTKLINNHLSAYEMWTGEAVLLKFICSLSSPQQQKKKKKNPKNKAGGESQPSACPSLLEGRKMMAQLSRPWSVTRMHLSASTLSAYYSS